MGTRHPSMPTVALLQDETKVLTVPADGVNQEINLRRLFGWTVQGTSARSFATHGTVVGGGAQVTNNLGVGGGAVTLHNTHLTDITFTRRLDQRRAPLRDLEHQHDNLRYATKPNLWGWTGGLFILGIYLFGAQIGANMEIGLRSTLAILGACLGAAGGIAIYVIRKRRADTYNANVNQTRQNILTAARRYWN